MNMVYRFKPSEREITNSALFKNFSISLNIYHGSFFFFFVFSQQIAYLSVRPSLLFKYNSRSMMVIFLRNSFVYYLTHE